MVTYTTTAYFISPSGKMVKQTYTFVQVNVDDEAETVAATTPHVEVERS